MLTVPLGSGHWSIWLCRQPAVDPRWALLDHDAMWLYKNMNRLLSLVLFIFIKITVCNKSHHTVVHSYTSDVQKYPVYKMTLYLDKLTPMCVKYNEIWCTIMCYYSSMYYNTIFVLLVYVFPMGFVCGPHLYNVSNASASDPCQILYTKCQQY